MNHIFQNKFFIHFILFVLIVSIQSCVSSRDNEPENGSEVSSNIRRYCCIKIQTTDKTRASESNDPEFSDGSEAEHTIDISDNSDHVVILFDREYRYKGFFLINFTNQAALGSSASFPNEGEIIGVIESDNPEELQSMPPFGLIVLNTRHFISQLNELEKNSSIQNVLKLVDVAEGGHDIGRNGNYFTMTSVAYLEKENNIWKHSILCDLDSKKVFETFQQAYASPAATAVVERMSTKFSLSFPGSVGGNSLSFIPNAGKAQVIVCDYIDGQPNYNNRHWTCSIDAWGINKFEKSSFYFKNIVGNNVSTSSYPYNYGSDINSTGNPFYNGWNRSADHRSLWAVDMNYENGIYPSQYRPAVDNNMIHYYGKKGEPSLGYLSYNELCSDFQGIGTENGIPSLYSSENTFPDIRTGGLWQHDFAATEVVIGARIHINGVDEKRTDYDLYRNRIGVFYPSVSDFANYFISTVNSQLASQSVMTYRYYDWTAPDNNNAEIIKNFQITKGNYKLYYKDKPLTPEILSSLEVFTIPATIENGDGKVIPWVEGMYIGRRNIDPNTYQEIGEIERLDIAANDLKSLIYDWIGSFDHFNKGRMIYAVPVRHNASESKVSANNYKPTVGDYGVVRNHWYRLAIVSINSLGTPIDDPCQKIIPYKTSLENSILMEIKVLDWHGFNTTVTLPGAL